MKCLLLILMALVCYHPPAPEFSYKTYGNVANFFASESEMKNFFSFNRGDVVAEVGAGNAENLVGFTLVSDSIVFYAQDIDSTVLSPSNFLKAVKRASRLKKANANVCRRVIGKESATHLPPGSFDKIILVSTFHEFSEMDEMLSDILSRLKPAGLLYILEARCIAKGHNNYSAEETMTKVTGSGFTLVKKDGKDINNSSGLYRLILQRKD